MCRNMGYIKEPKNVDLIVAPSVLTEEIKQSISLAIAHYKKTGKKFVSAEADRSKKILNRKEML